MGKGKGKRKGKGRAREGKVSECVGYVFETGSTFPVFKVYGGTRAGTLGA